MACAGKKQYERAPCGGAETGWPHGPCERRGRNTDVHTGKVPPDGLLVRGLVVALAHINREWDLKLTCDLAHRIQTHYRADMTAKRGKNSFLQKYGHIKLQKISEPIL